MKQIKLKHGKYALVDDEDFEYLNQYRWHISAAKYVATHIKDKKVYMHRLIMKTPKGLDTDHINRSTLDNRKSNLRVATRSENNVNTGLWKSNTSGHKGVYRDKKNRNWRVMIDWKKKHFNVGSFKNIRDAVDARQRAEQTLYAT